MPNAMFPHKGRSGQEMYADLVIAALRSVHLIQRTSCWVLRDQDTGRSSAHTWHYTGKNYTTEKVTRVPAATQCSAGKGQSEIIRFKTLSQNVPRILQMSPKLENANEKSLLGDSKVIAFQGPGEIDSIQHLFKAIQ